MDVDALLLFRREALREQLRDRTGGDTRQARGC
jgi:hypothetical protein